VIFKLKKKVKTAIKKAEISIFRTPNLEPENSCKSQTEIAEIVDKILMPEKAKTSADTTESERERQIGLCFICSWADRITTNKKGKPLQLAFFYFVISRYQILHKSARTIG
jgi:hypothetical protein